MIAMLTQEQSHAVDSAVKAVNTGQPLYRIGGYAGTGKSQPLSAKIQTPFGPIPMKDMAVGLPIFQADGRIGFVESIHPQGRKLTYEIIFRDSSSTRASADHLWAIKTPKDKQKGKSERIMTTQQMLDNGLYYKSGPAKYYIPLCDPVRYKQRNYSIPPYVLGVAIGDGYLKGNSPSLILSDSGIAKRVQNELGPEYVLTRPKQGCVWYNITYPAKTHSNPFKKAIDAINLNVTSRDKFIPVQYLTGSVEQRWDLLRGLMDTDGSARGNRISFSTVSNQLAEDICTLVQSLGGTAIKHEYDRRDKGIEYEINIKTFENPFYIESKAKNWKLSWKNPPSRAIVCIKPLTEEEHQCISVESKDGLYLTDDFIVTHNTTVAKYIVEDLEGGLFCAFTGKAAYRLREKGLDGTATIHRTIYDYDANANRFERKDDIDGNYFLIDEGSMISRDLWTDLNYFGKPIILLGDPGQLEPVGSDPKLMHSPDIILRQIHRQAENSGIVQFATDIRLGQFQQSTYPDVEISYGARPKIKDLKWADIVLCGYNRTRLTVNKLIRQIHGYTGLLCGGEKIIVLKNNIQRGVFNGQILTVSDIVHEGDTTITAKCVTDDGELTLPLFKKQFGNKPLGNVFGQSEMIFADYGYCVTCHKSQGSEWDKVVVIDEQCPKLWDAKRWRYTAITRAAKGLRYFGK